MPEVSPTKSRLEEATVWVEGLDKLNQGAGIRFCVDLSATPFLHPGQWLRRGLALPLAGQ